MTGFHSWLRCMALIDRVEGCIKDRKGQGLVEYALILVFIALVVFLMLKGVGKSVCSSLSSVNSSMTNP